MTPEEKIEKFKEPLSYIKNNKIKEFATEGIKIMPDYFFEIPASSSGKYHPNYALGEGGLLRHTISAIRIAIELSRVNFWGLTDTDLDLAIVSLILHDGWKSGEEGEDFTVFEHPLVAVNVLKRDKKIPFILPLEYTERIFANIETHMGQWTVNWNTGEETLTAPKGKHQIFVHQCDYLASRKCLEMNFDAPLSKK